MITVTSCKASSTFATYTFPVAQLSLSDPALLALHLPSDLELQQHPLSLLGLLATL